jgi:hypothetical protein
MTGLKISHNLFDLLTLTAWVGNGWNMTYENNRNKTLGGRVDVHPGFGLTASASYTGGNELTTSAGDDVRTVMDGTVNYDVLELGLLKLGAEFAQGSEQINGGTTFYTTSTTASAQLNLLFGVSMGARYEMMNDGGTSFGPYPNGYFDASGVNQGGLNVNALSGVLRYDQDEFSLKAEYRQDIANQTVFVNQDGPTNVQSVVVVSGGIRF